MSEKYAKTIRLLAVHHALICCTNISAIKNKGIRAGSLKLDAANASIEPILIAAKIIAIFKRKMAVDYLGNTWETPNGSVAAEPVH